MGNAIVLKDKNGNSLFPVTDVSLVTGLQEGALMETEVVQTLPSASSETVGKIYLIESETEGEYDRYLTTYANSAYTWTQLGSTAIPSPVIADNLTTNDATKALSAKQGKVLNESLTQLGQKVDDLALGKFYGFFSAATDLPAGDEPGYAYVGSSDPYRIYNFNGSSWVNSGADISVVSTNIIHTIQDLKFALNNGVKNIIFDTLGAYLELGESIQIPSGVSVDATNAFVRRTAGYNGNLFALATRSILKGITIDGNRSSVTNPSWSSTTEITIRAYSLVEDCTIINGNEAIICYGDWAVVRRCKISDCSGNGIHFSGGDHQRVENCRVVNTNILKRTGAGEMGHDDGCIIWSNLCNYTICKGNYCELGLSGFGSLDTADNSFAIIEDNYVKDCDYAIEAIQPTRSSLLRGLSLIGNTFENSNKVDIHESDSSHKIGDIKGIIIKGNRFINTGLQVTFTGGSIIDGNYIDGGTLDIGYNLALTFTNNFVKIGGGISPILEDSVISNNIINCRGYLFNLQSDGRNIVTNNIFRQTSTTSQSFTNQGVTVKSNTIFDGNVVCMYSSGRAIQVNNNSKVLNNTIIHANEDNVGIIVFGGASNIIVKNNQGNCPNSISSITNGIASDNFTTYSPGSRGFLDVTCSMPDCTLSGWGKVLYADDYYAKLEGTALPGSISITMGGSALAASDFTYDPATGDIVIPNCTGAIVIS